MRALDLVFPAVLAVVVLAGSLLLYPWDSDASIIAHDPVYYAESGQSDPWGSVPAQHLLYHVLVNIVTGAGEVMGVEHPGHAAVRLVSGMGALALLLLICTIAGPGRRSLGALLCLPLLLTRTFVFEAAVGESVIPGAAAGLWMLRVSCQLRATTRLTVFAVVLACLMRQDNVLLVPVAMVCFALRASPGQGARRTFRVFGVAGAITAALYLIAWMVTEPQAELLEYVIHVASEPWSADLPEPAQRILDHLAICGVAVVGQQWEWSTSYHLTVGLAFTVALLLAGALLRGEAGGRSLAMAIAAALIVRVFFFAWFEYANHEWWLLPLSLVTALTAALIRGRPRTSIPARRWGAALLLGLSAAVAVAHGRDTLALSQRTVCESRELATALALERPNARFVAYGQRVHTALHIARQPHVTLDGQPSQVMERLRAMLNGSSAPLILVVDRFAWNGMPWQRRQASDPLSTYLDAWQPERGERLLRRQGRVVVVAWNLD